MASWQSLGSNRRLINIIFKKQPELIRRGYFMEVARPSYLLSPAWINLNSSRLICSSVSRPKITYNILR